MGGNDTLDGGAGNDTMAGGMGDDTYLVDNAGDVVSEAAGAGMDLVQSSVTHTLAANVENLTLTGAAAINATGNALALMLTGNSGNNALSGAAGNDTMIGGAGNDTYVVDAAGDVVVENADEGTDLVQSSVTYTLSGNVENLTLTEQRHQRDRQRSCQRAHRQFGQQCPERRRWREHLDSAAPAAIPMGLMTPGMSLPKGPMPGPISCSPA